MTELWQKSGAEIARLVSSKQVSAVEVTNSTLARIEAVNSKINAVVQEMPDEALAAAAEIDAKIAKGETVGSMAGVPVTAKESVDQAGFATTNGLRLQKDLIATQDHPAITNMKNAGAVVVGRTNTPAFSLRWFTRNDLHGHTKNPHNPSITPGGSSGGASAATASGIGAVGHGTDIGGSIRYPAYACGLHGLRPSLGRVPAANLSAPDRHIGAQLMAVSGPITRTVEDLRIGFEAMAAENSLDPWWTPVPLELPPQPKRVALVTNPCAVETHPNVKAALVDAANRLEQTGWEVEEVDGPDMHEPARRQAVLWLADFGRVAEMVKSEGNEDAQFVYQQMLRHCPNPDLNAVLDALQIRVTLMRKWHQFFEKFPVILCPNSAEPPFPDLLDISSPDDFDRVFAAQLPQIASPFLGLPGCSVATSISVENIPMGVQLIGDRFREDTLLNAASDIEAAGPVFPPIDPA